MELKLNKAKVNHLLGLLEINEREGWYYGNKEHYLKRHNELNTELKLLIASVVVPKGTCCLKPKKIGKVNDMFESWDECKNCGKEVL